LDIWIALLKPKVVAGKYLSSGSLALEDHHEIN
jgi:hypothetical protein